MLEEISSYVSIVFVILGFLAFIVSVITQVIKNLKFLKKVPTDIVVLILSNLLTILTYVIIADICQFPSKWYGFIAAIIAGFMVTFIATYGWSKFNDIYSRYIKNKS